MKVGIVGSGYALDHYMSTWSRYPDLQIAGITDRDPGQVDRAARHYGLPTYRTTAELLADATVDIVLNLTSIPSHYEVTRAALEAGKHVFSEKPLVTSVAQARDLFVLAESRSLWLACAPSNTLSSTVQTMWRAVADGAVGDVRLAYAELDDNPIYLMAPEEWRSASGAPWPYLQEYEMGCTWEHVGYHLTWMCAMFGPVRSVTAFSKHTLPDKTDKPLSPPDTPDFSVACLDFESGVVGRITCSIAAPFDHRMRVIGNRGMVHADNVWHYDSPVRIEPFTTLTLNARKAAAVRSHTALQRLLGVGGRKVRPVPMRRSRDTAATASEPLGHRPNRVGMLRRVLRTQLGQEDKCIGVAELADAIADDRPPFPGHDFTLHLTELTLAIQASGPDGTSHRLESRFDPLPPPAHDGADYRGYNRRSLLDLLSASVLTRLHRQ